MGIQIGGGGVVCVMFCGDRVIDLGPDGGNQGGGIAAEGTPRKLADHSTGSQERS